VTDIDALPPVQYLILEVLAARYRLGEHLWTFPSIIGRHVDALNAAGLVDRLNGITPKTVRARLTGKGLAAVLDDGYPLPDLLRQRDEAQAQLARVIDWAERQGPEQFGAVMDAITREEAT
jgi:hypothetical protein